MTEVLICDATPESLFLALSLNKQGISTRVVDQRKNKNETTNQLLSISPVTLETLDHADLLHTIKQKSIQIDNLSYHFKKQTINFPLKDTKLNFPYILYINSFDLEEILTEELNKHNTTIEWDSIILTINNREAVIQNNQNNTKEVCKPLWIISNDPDLSEEIKKKFQGILKINKQTHQFYETKIQSKEQTINTSHTFFFPKSNIKIIPKNDGLSVISINYFKNSKVENDTINKSLHFLKAKDFNDLSYTEKNVISSSHNFSTKDNIIVLGRSFPSADSFMRYNINASILENFTFSWQLSLIIKGLSPLSLLQKYSLEQEFFSKLITKYQSKNKLSFLKIIQKIYPQFACWGMFSLLYIKKIKQKIDNKGLLSTPNNRQSPISQGDVLEKDWKEQKIGDKAKNFKISQDLTLFDCLRKGKHIILTFGYSLNIQEAINEYYPDCFLFINTKQNDVLKKYQASENSIFIIRPDGFISYRSKTTSNKNIVSYLLKIFIPSHKKQTSKS